MNAIVKTQANQLTPSEHNEAIRTALKTSLYPGAGDDSIEMVLAYCRAGGYDPLLKVVHIVPMWDSKAGKLRDVVMPGIGLYRTNAARTGQFAGISEPEFGPMVTERLGKADFTFPEWCKVTAYRQLTTGHVAEFTAVEYWVENYAIKGGKEQDQSPNAMWAKRARGQLAKCAQAQALRMAFPEAVGNQPTAEEMEGKIIEGTSTPVPARNALNKPQPAGVIDSPERDALYLSLQDISTQGLTAYSEAWEGLTKEQRKLIGASAHEVLKAAAIESDAERGENAE